MKRISIYILFLFFSSPITAQKTMTLEEAVQVGIKNNLDINQAGLQMQSEEIDYKQSRALMLPDLNIIASQGINQGRSIDPFTNSFISQNYNYGSYGASSSVLLFKGGALQNRIQRDRLGFEAAKLEKQDAIDRITINVILAYLQILSAEEVLKQTQDQVSVTQKQVERLELMNSKGAIAPATLYDLKGQYANEEVAIVDQQGAVDRAKLNLLQLLNIPFSKNFEVAPVTVDGTEAAYGLNAGEVYNMAVQNFARIKAARLRTESSEKGIKAAKGDLLPSLYLSGNLNTNYSSVASRSFLENTTEIASKDYVTVNGEKVPVIIQQSNYRTDKINFGDQLGNNLFSSVNLTLNIPVFNAFQASNRIKKARISYQSNQLREQSSRTELQHDVENAYLNLVNSFEKYNLLQEQVAAFTESFRSAEIRFNAGLITSVDYLVAKNNLDRAQTSLIISKYDQILRSKVLDYYQGKKLW